MRGLGVLAIDFEASCLPRHGRSFPIEVAIADERGAMRSWLIRPAPQWSDWTWTQEAETLHGLTRERLFDEGQPVEAVAQALRQFVQGRRLFADSYLDEGWMQTLMAAAAQADAPRVEHIEALIDRLGVEDAQVGRCIALVDQLGFARHRAGPDARWLAALIAALTDSQPASVRGLWGRVGQDRGRAKIFQIGADHVAQGACGP